MKDLQKFKSAQKETSQSLLAKDKEIKELKEDSKKTQQSLREVKDKLGSTEQQLKAK
jgi:predicted  nucleic acid-binding Zn-ribbon protein